MLEGRGASTLDRGLWFEDGRNNKPERGNAPVLLQGRLLGSGVTRSIYSDVLKSNVLFLVMDCLYLPDISNATGMPKELQLLMHPQGQDKWR